MKPSSSQQAQFDEVAQMVAAAQCEMPYANTNCPMGSNKVYEVSISEAHGSVDRSETAGWCWDLYRLPMDKQPQMTIDIAPFSPTVSYCTLVLVLRVFHVDICQL